jgi:hypothetical protein
MADMGAEHTPRTMADISAELEAAKTKWEARWSGAGLKAPALAVEWVPSFHAAYKFVDVLPDVVEVELHGEILTLVYQGAKKSVRLNSGVEATDQLSWQSGRDFLGTHSWSELLPYFRYLFPQYAGLWHLAS